MANLWDAVDVMIMMIIGREIYNIVSEGWLTNKIATSDCIFSRY